MSLNRKLRTLAEQLPPYPKLDASGNMLTTKVVKSGHEILAKIPDAKCAGEPIDPKGRYLQPQVVLCNHFKQMKSVLAANPGKKPEEVLNDYVAQVYAYHNKTATLSAEPVPNNPINQ